MATSKNLPWPSQGEKPEGEAARLEAQNSGESGDGEVLPLSQCSILLPGSGTDY